MPYILMKRYSIQRSSAVAANVSPMCPERGHCTPTLKIMGALDYANGAPESMYQINEDAIIVGEAFS